MTAAHPLGIPRFLTSADTLAQMPADRGAEVAFAGRSNAGKSSALNTLTGVRALARTSKTPGRTQLVNFFALHGDRRLVDLPGYGYARVPEATRRHWEKLLDGYLRTRASLKGLVIIMDARHPLTPLDHQFLDWCQVADMPAHVLLSKADKLTRGAATQTLRTVERSLAAAYPGVTVQLFSAQTRLGLAQAYTVLGDWLGLEIGTKKEAPETRGKESGAKS